MTGALIWSCSVISISVNIHESSLITDWNLSERQIWNQKFEIHNHGYGIMYDDTQLVPWLWLFPNTTCKRASRWSFNLVDFTQDSKSADLLLPPDLRPSLFVLMYFMISESSMKMGYEHPFKIARADVLILTIQVHIITINIEVAWHGLTVTCSSLGVDRKPCLFWDLRDFQCGPKYLHNCEVSNCTLAAILYTVYTDISLYLNLYFLIAFIDIPTYQTF